MIHWAYPWVALLLLPLWLLAGYRMLRRNPNPPGILFAPTDRLPRAHVTWRTVLVDACPWLWMGGLLLLILACARPQTPWAHVHRQVDAIAIQVVVDVSGSMEALDLSPQPLHSQTLQTRLDVVKEVFDDFIRRRPHDQIGLTTFGGYATTRSPLTLDHAALRHILSGVEIPHPGHDETGAGQDMEILLTAIGDALASGLTRLRQAETETRILLLLSDGESNTGIIEPAEAAEAARTLGVRIYTIGIGTDAPAPFRTRDAFGRETLQYARITYDEPLLEHIAAHTGGRYFNVRDPEGLEQALRDIDRLETTAVQESVFEINHERFLPFAAAGAATTALAALIHAALRRNIA